MSVVPPRPIKAIISHNTASIISAQENSTVFLIVNGYKFECVVVNIAKKFTGLFFSSHKLSAEKQSKFMFTQMLISYDDFIYIRDFVYENYQNQRQL